MTSTPYSTDNEWRVRQAGGDWIAFPTKGPITVQQVATFPAKVTIGETSKGSHPMLSTWAFSGLTSGHGVVVHDGTTTRRYRSGLVDTRNAHFFASPRKAEKTVGGAGDFMPHNDLVVSGTRRLFGSFGTDLYLWDETTESWSDTTRNLTAAAVNPGVAFAGTSTLRLFIPMGSSGYARETGAALTNVAASGTQPAARDFVRLNTTLICLDTSSQLWWSTDGSTWTSFGTAGKLDAGINGRRLKIYKNGYGDKTVHIATDTGLYAFDPAGPVIYDTDLELPPHPYQGMALERWRDQLYIAGGMGVFSWNGSAVAPMGLDRDHGLLNIYRGHIVDLCGTLNGLYAIVQSDSTTESLHEWTGEGWQMLWIGGGHDLSKLVVSAAQGGYRLWWGYDADAMSLPISPNFANAEQLAEASIGAFERNWHFLSGENAFEMEGFTKIAVSIAWDEYSQDDSSTTFKYRTNDVAIQTNMPGYVFPAGTGSSTTAEWRHYEYEFGYDGTNARFYGLPFEWIELIWNGGGSTDYTGPDIIKNVVFTFQKVVEGFRAFTIRVDLQALYDQDKGDLADLLNDLVTANEYCDFQYRQEVIRAYFSSWGGADATGQATQDGTRTVSLLEIQVTP